MPEDIIIKGIETNNLKNIDVKLLKPGINLIIGSSGSGKSSLAYETISQIGKYEYLSMFEDNLQEPIYKIKSYLNILPAVPIKQLNRNNNTKSTIATYFGLNRKINLIFSAVNNLDEDYFNTLKEENVCKNCHGSGIVKILDINKVIDYNTKICDIPVRCWNRYKDFYSSILKKYCDDEGIDIEKRFRELSSEYQDRILYGESDKKYSIKYKKSGYIASRTTRYHGIMTNKVMLLNHKPSEKYYSDKICPVCCGMRYNSEHERYKVAGLSIGEMMTTPFQTLEEVFGKVEDEIKDIQLSFSVKKISQFISKACELKLGHLFFNRSIPTVSGGELQRLRMVQVFNSQLTNLLIVLDEPFDGLSIKEQRIIKKNICDLAKMNSVVVVDHENQFSTEAKNIICLGPNGGAKGGYLIDKNDYIKSIQKDIKFSAPKVNDYYNIKINSNIYGYKGVNVKIALNHMNLIIGDSGIGKSTLLREYLPQVFDSYLYINQRPLLGNVNSSVATSIELATKLFSFFGKQFKKDRNFFSNLTGSMGCCSRCGGSGIVEIGNQKDNQIRIVCKDCKGTGFSSVLNDYKIDGKSIVDLWKMTIDEVEDFYRDKDKKISSILYDVKSLNLGYLLLGQPVATLSGGENIRIKLLKNICTNSQIIGVDEPFKGLNINERELIAIFLDSLRRKNKTIIVIDHTKGMRNFFSSVIEVRRINDFIVGT